jgi:hypothetical protein
MPDTLNTYFQFSQLSMAAYANLTVTSSGDIDPTQLQSAGFTLNLATQFAATYKVKSQSNPSITGFSATLFETKDANQTKILAIRGTNDPADILIDLVNVALIGSENLNPQYDALKNYVDTLTGVNGPLAGQAFTLTGHSLGGFLAQALRRRKRCQEPLFALSA